MPVMQENQNSGKESLVEKVKVLKSENKKLV
jgi:hypothetical protein